MTPPNLIVDTPEVPATADDVAGTRVYFMDHLTATDNGVPLPTTSISCLPASDSLFPLGATHVSCQVLDAVGNRASTSFLVTVASSTGPTISGSNLVAEAKGPGGAAVGYRITASGFVSNCAAPGSSLTQACTTWKPAYRGLGFVPTALTMNPTDGPAGALYAGVSNTAPFGEAAGCTQTVVRSKDRGATWEELTSPGRSTLATCGLTQLLVIPASAGGLPTILSVGELGLSISRDGGNSWSLVQNRALRGVAADPADPAHMVAWTEFLSAGVGVLETRDGWRTQTDISDGLPATQILGVALDPFNPGRAYLSVGTAFNEAIRTKLYRRTGAGPWQRLSVPLTMLSRQYAGLGLTISPQLELCQSTVQGQTCEPCPTGQGQPGQNCQTFPTVFAGTVISRDGGETWREPHSGFPFGARALFFDRQNPNNIYVFSPVAVASSRDGGLTFDYFGIPPGIPGQFGTSFVQDAAQPHTFYSANDSGPSDGWGLAISEDEGQSWRGLQAPGLSLQGDRIGHIAADPVDPSVAYLSSRTGIFKTTDGGESWAHLDTGIEMSVTTSLFQQAKPMLVDPINRNNVYWTGIGILKSPDGGDHWFDPNPASGELLALNPLRPGYLIMLENEETDLDPGRPALAWDLTPAGLTQIWSIRGLGNIDLFRPYNLQIVPDAARTGVLSWHANQPLPPTGCLDPKYQINANTCSMSHF